MEIRPVDEESLIDLYDLSKELASEEGQSELFTATLAEYQVAFLSTPCAIDAFVCTVGDQAIGFYTYLYKYATYIGSKVLHIEDIYVKEMYRDNFLELVFEHAKDKAIKEKCCRVEMRVLKSFNMGVGHIQSAGFEKIEKWDVFRFSCENHSPARKT